ncbi:MAG TPA: putative oxidoreductase C-terminal domain-containing protein [Chitinophagaceae bacterium]|nr:putative oxidoreductase C-terminal domain-containing protein [Chitinophagaceae bacterium]
MKRPLFVFFLFIIAGCTSTQKIATLKNEGVHLITLDPGHFHAALVQKTMYPGVDPVVHVYAPDGPDLQLHLDRINSYNNRAEDPTRWKEDVYTGNDFLDKMLTQKRARPNGAAGRRNVVVMAGNNQKKTEYIFKAINAGFNVLADKPMAIDKKNFELLRSAFVAAEKKNVLLYDIMTERYEITTILQKELSLLPRVFGQLTKGTAENPAVTKESVHHFFKYISGSALIRPPWFMDVTQEGEGIVDVTTHLVDLVQWECFPEQVIDYTKDIKLTSARRWSTDMTATQFNALTKLNGFPGYLKKYVVNDTVLKVYSNSEINYALKGVHAKVSVIWKFKAPEGTGDTHYSIMRGTKASLVIRQGAEQNYKPVLYIEPIDANDASYANTLKEQLRSIQSKYPGVDIQKNTTGWKVIIPEKYNEGHETHFARVMEKFLQYFKEGRLPVWEVPNMIAKYYTTTSALEMALQTKGTAQ